MPHCTSLILSRVHRRRAALTHARFHSHHVCSSLVTSGTAPAARSGHTANVVDGKLIVFGGSTAGGYANDVHVLDLLTWVWTLQATTGTVPCARGRHTANIVAGKIIVFGGADSCGNIRNNHVRVLDPSTWAWR